MFERGVELEAAESARKEYIALARATARTLASRRSDRLVTIDDVREVCPPPDGIDPRVLGAVFAQTSLWSYVGQMRSARPVCHHRPIKIFRLIDTAPVAKEHA